MISEKYFWYIVRVDGDVLKLCNSAKKIFIRNTTV